MMKWFKRYNIASKLLALFGAATLWFFVISADNQNTESVLSNIPVEYTGLELLHSKGYVILEGGAQKANVTISCPVNKLLEIKDSLDMIKAWVDVSSLNPGRNEVRLYAYLDQNDSSVSIVDRRPQTFIVIVDRIIDKPVPVEVETLGELAGGYRISSRDVWPTLITVNGPETYLRDIKCARVSYDVTGMTGSDSINLTFELIKEDGSLLEEAKMSWIKTDVASIELTLDVRRDSMVNLRVAFTGIPEYLSEDAIDHRIDPGSISVTGEPQAIDGLNYIDLGEINVKNVIENNLGAIEKTIALPNGVSSSMNGKTATIYITFPGYEHREMSFTSLDLPEIEGVSYPEQQLELRIFGMTDDLELVRPEDIIFEPQISSAGHEPGEYTVPVTVSCAVEGVYVLGKYTAVITVHEMPSDAEPPDGDDGG